MAVGFSQTRTDIDNRAGTLAVSLRNLFDEIDRFETFLAAALDADLEALGYTAGDIAVLKSGIGDLAQLAGVYRGAAALAAAKDFRTFANRLVGVL